MIAPSTREWRPNKGISTMRRHVVRIALIFAILSGLSGVPAAQQQGAPPPQVSGKANVLDHHEQREAHYSRIGKGKGTGFRQYTRQAEFVMPRSYPSGDRVNLTALTWAHHHRTVQSPEFRASKAAAAAAGI